MDSRQVFGEKKMFGTAAGLGSGSRFRATILSTWGSSASAGGAANSHWVSSRNRDPLRRRLVPTRPLRPAKLPTVVVVVDAVVLPWPRWLKLLMQLAWYMIASVCVCVCMQSHWRGPCTSSCAAIRPAHAQTRRSETAKFFRFPNGFLADRNSKQTPPYCL